MRSISRITGLCAIAFAAVATQATAAVGVHAGANAGIGASALIGAQGASISASAPGSIGVSGSGPMGAASAGGNDSFGANASASRSGAAASAAFAAALGGSSTVRNIGSGTLTLVTSSGQSLTLTAPSRQVQALGLHVGSNVALTQTSAGVRITNLDYLRSLTGRGTVRRVAANSITFANRTGMHTIALARGAASRLRLRPGSSIVVSAVGATQLQLMTVAQASHR
ncbi:MAG TPA: hypothetical protein VIN40_10200 [Candidatus Tyrphobacter sp.]